jgi:hypothetical protein
VKLFGRTLNFKRIKEQGLKWLICVADKDDLVEKESALAPLDWVEAEVTVFPKGHVAIATSWSLPTTECSLDRCFLDYRGPVRYQLDLEAEEDKALMAAATIRKEKSASAPPSTPGPAPAAAPAPKRQEIAAKAPAPKRPKKATKAPPAAPKKRKG